MKMFGNLAGKRWWLASGLAVCGLLAWAAMDRGVAGEDGFRVPDPLEAFPAAEAGQTRHVIAVPPQEDEFAFKVEVFVGKTVEVDPHNRFFFGGALEEVEMEGWGYSRYVLRQLGPLAGTRMAPLPNQPQVERFIPVGGGGLMLRYNSRLPIVVYVPEGVEVRYRIWSAGPMGENVPQG